MSLIGNVGRKSFKNRSIMIMIYILLSIMGITMVVPFLITISGSMSNNFDYERYSPVPRSLWSKRDRFVKGLVYFFEGYRNKTKILYAYAPDTPAHWTSWAAAGRDIQGVDNFAKIYQKSSKDIVSADYAEFMERYPLTDTVITIAQTDAIAFVTKYYTQKYKALHPRTKISGTELEKQALLLLNKEWGIPYDRFFNVRFNSETSSPLDFQGWFPNESNLKYQSFQLLKKYAAAHNFTPGVESLWRKYLKKKNYKGEMIFPVLDTAPEELRKLWFEFKREYVPATQVIPFPARIIWYDFLGSEELAMMNNGSGLTIKEYNTLCNTHYRDIYETPFPIPASFPSEMQKLWRIFLRNHYPMRLMKIDSSASMDRNYRNFVKKQLKTLKIANGLLGTNCKSWDDFKFPRNPETGSSRIEVNRQSLWKNFVKIVPIKNKKYTSSEIRYQQFLLGKYGSLEKINETYGWHLAHIEEAFPPFMAAYEKTFRNIDLSLSFVPIWRNYYIVLKFLLGNGNAVWVTLLLIAMTLFCTLTINPLAAYALSRFSLRGKDKILIFMLATMAFPAMVSAIPAYLLMRDLGMLNTYWALVIPGAANGMAIFILKGFFDSLPMELFEAATIDGASEMQIFWIVAMPLVKPILAINCLNAFISAYNGWTWALIICQDQKMWTIAVWLYQASRWWSGSPWLISAGFILASIPTFIVFVSCQKIILRGIIIPSMK